MQRFGAMSGSMFMVSEQHRVAEIVRGPEQFETFYREHLPFVRR